MYKVELKALWATFFWIGLALLFNLGIFVYLGREAGLNFLMGYLIEKSLSIDNLFVFIVLFKYFKTPEEYQHKVLFWGIVGALLMRALMIFFGLALINAFSWMLYLFGAFLVYTGIKMIQKRDVEADVSENRMLKWLQRSIPMSSEYDGDKFFTKKSTKWVATPLFVVLLAIEFTDLVFALDSIPAIMGITLDPFIIYTSNIFAILGLRSLFFVLARLMSLFHYLHYVLAAILIFVGCKMIFFH